MKPFPFPLSINCSWKALTLVEFWEKKPTSFQVTVTTLLVVSILQKTRFAPVDVPPGLTFPVFPLVSTSAQNGAMIGVPRPASIDVGVNCLSELLNVIFPLLLIKILLI